MPSPQAGVSGSALPCSVGQMAVLAAILLGVTMYSVTGVQLNEAVQPQRPVGGGGGGGGGASSSGSNIEPPVGTSTLAPPSAGVPLPTVEAPIQPASERSTSTEEEQKDVELDHGKQLYPDLVTARFSADNLWPALVDYYGLNKSVDIENRYVVEVGAFDGHQASYAAARGFGLIVLEPSPHNFKKAVKRVAVDCGEAPAFTKCNQKLGVRLFNVAGSSHNHTVQFMTASNTGDHVVGDKKQVALGEENTFLKGGGGGGKKTKKHRKPHIVNVQAAPIDAYISALKPGSVHVLKIDTQDHEPAVIKGMKELLQRTVPEVIMIEFRPQGWAHMFPTLNPASSLNHLCGRSNYDCYFLARQNRDNWTDWEWQFSRADYIRPGEIITSEKLVQHLYQCSNNTIDSKFGCWTDIAAFARRPSAQKILDTLLKQQCGKSEGGSKPSLDIELLDTANNGSEGGPSTRCRFKEKGQRS